MKEENVDDILRSRTKTQSRASILEQLAILKMQKEQSSENAVLLPQDEKSRE